MLRKNLILLIILISCCGLMETHDKFLESNNNEENAFTQFCQPLQFTQEGIKNFFRDIFNKPEYAREFLPHNLSHLTQFLSYGKNSNQGTLYMQAALRLYTNATKRAPYTTCPPLIECINQMPDLLKDAVAEKSESWLSKAQKTMKKMLYKVFLGQFSLFKQDPDQFFENLSLEIIQEISNTDLQEPITAEQCRQQLVRFLETSLNKLIWSPLDQYEVWRSFNELSESLKKLADCKILNEDDFDDLLQSLVARFIYFLELSGNHLSSEVMGMIQQDLQSDKPIINHIEEQEESIESKSSRLKTAVVSTHAKIYARERGIIVE